MDSYRDLPKSIKILIWLISLTVILLITNFIFYKMYTKEEPFDTMAYYQEMVGGTEKEILERFKLIGVEYKETTIEEASKNVSKLVNAPKPLHKDIEELFENKNVNILETVNIEDYNGLVLGYGVKDGISDNELAEIITTYKKQNKEGIIISYSDKDLIGVPFVYLIAEKYETYVNSTGDYEGIDKSFENNKFSIGHVIPELDVFVPQFFVVENGIVNKEKTNNLYKDIPQINRLGEVF